MHKNNVEIGINNESALIKAFKFFNSLFPDNKNLIALKHLYIDMLFRLE